MLLSKDRRPLHGPSEVDVGWLVRGPDLPTKWAKSGVGYRFRLHKSFHNVHLSKGRKCHLTKRGAGRSPAKKIFEVEYEEKMHALHPHTPHN